MTGRLTRRRLLVTAGTTAVAGCSGGDSDPEATRGQTTPVPDTTPTPAPTPVEDGYDHPLPGDEADWEPPTGSPRDASVAVEPIVENLEIPWDLAVAGDGEVFLTERTGTVLRFDSGEIQEVTSPREAIDAGAIEPGSDDRPWWVEGGEGGTLGIAVHPDYPDERYVYVYYTAEGPRNRVVRYDVSASDVAGTETPIVDDIPADNVHNGGRIAFGPDDNLWICTGDAAEPDLSRDPSSLAGKVLRVSPGGESLASNPDLDGDPRVFTVGHRNPQGIDWLPNRVPVVTEHGPSARDELQLLRPGGDYGWNDVRSGPDDDLGSYADHDDVVPPVVNTGNDTWAPSGGTFYTGGAIPAWHNRFVLGGLVSQSIFVVTLTPPDGELPPLDDESWRFDADWTHDAYTASAHRVLRDELGRVRLVTTGPGNELYAITSNRDGRATDPFPRERDDVLVRLASEE